MVAFSSCSCNFDTNGKFPAKMSKRRDQSKSERNDEALESAAEETISYQSDAASTPLPTSPNAHELLRTFDCDDSDGRTQRFMYATITDTNVPTEVDFEPASMEIHGEWMYPEKHYESILGSPQWLQHKDKNESVDKEKEKNSAQRNERKYFKVNQPGSFFCCCCCMRSQMIQCCCCCCNTQRSCSSNRQSEYQIEDGYERQNGRKGSQRSSKKKSRSQTSQRREITQSEKDEKDCKVEFRVTKDMDLATVCLNKADDGFSKGINETAESELSASKPVQKRQIKPTKRKSKCSNLPRSRK